MTVKKEPTALSTVKSFNDLARRAADKGSETLGLIWKAGEIAKTAKSVIPHGEWMKFVEKFYDVSHKTVTTWMKFHETVPESKLEVTSNLTAAIKMLDPPKEAPRDAPADVPDDQEPENIHEEEDAAFDRPTRPSKKKKAKIPRKLDRKAYYKQWDSAIGPLVRLVSKIGHGVDEHGSAKETKVQKCLHDATAAMIDWMEVKK